MVILRKPQRKSFAVIPSLLAHEGLSKILRTTLLENKDIGLKTELPTQLFILMILEFLKVTEVWDNLCIPPFLHR